MKFLIVEPSTLPFGTKSTRELWEITLTEGKNPNLQLLVEETANLGNNRMNNGIKNSPLQIANGLLGERMSDKRSGKKYFFFLFFLMVNCPSKRTSHQLAKVCIYGKEMGILKHYITPWLWTGLYRGFLIIKTLSTIYPGRTPGCGLSLKFLGSLKIFKAEMKWHCRS